MQETSNPKNFDNSDHEIHLLEIFSVLLQGKFIIFSLTAFLSTVTVIFSLLLPNMYESKVLLAPINSSSGISGALKGYSSLAGLAGLTLPSSVDDSNTAKAIKKIVSLSFFEENILTKIYLPDLMAVKAWKPKTNMIVFDENIFDSNKGSWVRNYSYPQQQKPSAQESFEKFKQHISLNEDNKTGFITLSIKHQSPYVAKQWVELVVNEINNFYREKDKLESGKAVNYLNQQIATTTYSEIKEVLAELLQEESKKLTLIEANQFYVFDIIDPPVVMERNSEPNRVLIFILGSLMGGMLSILFLLIRYYFFRKISS